MRKFWAVVKHEYKKIVLKWTFLIGTFLFPVFIGLLGSVPAIIFSMKGEPTRIAVVDLSGKVAERIKDNLSPEKIAARAERAARESMKNLDASQQERLQQGSQQLSGDFVFVDYDAANKSPVDIRADLTSRVLAGELDAYLLVPENFDSPDAVFEFRSRRGGDFVAGGSFRDAVNSAVRSQRLADANISEEKLDAINAPVNFDEKGLNERGEEKDTTGVFVASFGIGLMIYITLAIYGQAIMGAVVEEKETRIAEILFSSARPFQLMMGKLVGVGLAGLTQLSIWVGSVAIFLGIAATQVSLTQLLGSLPVITPLMFLYFLIFFLLGFFIYASIFALIGSMVTSVQEGGQFSFPPIMILLIGFYFSFAVVRDPNSDLSFWVSIAPFFAPITMPVRILAETPPFWQILLSFVVNALAIAGLVWLAARVYRVGMLMYGKRATIPEVWKWVRES
jgi:ABC-2 type transport system permease protein